MGKLNIAHHKSYHPYRRDNIERVRRDEEEARLKEQREEGKMMLADSEARIDVLRQKAGLSEQFGNKDKRHKDVGDMKHISSSSMQSASLPTTNGHINFFEDLEQTQNAISAAIKVSKKATSSETDKGVPLGPTPKDLKPWYAENKEDKLGVAEEEEEKKRREEYRKSAHDPLTSITKQLAVKTSTNVMARSFMRPPPQRKAGNADDRPPDVQARLSRESSERMRAMELIRRKKREMEGNSTPSTVFGDSASEYGDLYNRREVEEAHKHRDRWRDGSYGHRKWDDDDRSRDQHPRQW